MKVTDEERAQIEAALRDGRSLGSVSKESGRGRATVWRIAQAAGIEVDHSATNKANAARRDYAQAERLGLLNRFFTKAGAMLSKVGTPLELQQLTTALAIMVDKRRLEDGEATSRSETHDDTNAREQLAARLDELAARRAARDDRRSDRATG